MFLIILIAFFCLMGLIILHELGHFVLAKKFGVRVEEFGIGFPPRLIGKKIGETLYSLNLLPFGAFVKIHGEEGGIEDIRSFSHKPIWQRALIVLGGVISFWIVAAIILSIVMGLGASTVVSDEENKNLINPKIQIAAIVPNSPAEFSGLKPGDTIKEFSPAFSGIQFSINKVKELQGLTEKYKGQEVILTIERGKDIFDISLVPRTSPPADEGPMGVALVRTAIKSYLWYEAPWQGIKATVILTIAIVNGFGLALINLFRGLPTGVQVMGPVGIFSMFGQAGQLGVNYFLQFIAIISLHLAVINLFPIPALDGGKFIFLVIEAVRKKPISPKIEQGITAVFFTLLVALMIWVTIKDVIRLF